MVDLPRQKVGIVACSGEEMGEGTVTRLAALRVLEELRPQDTVTICLPLFLAGGEGERAFARFYPTIALDGCELRCAARATEAYSGKPAASLVVSELAEVYGLEAVQGSRRLNEAGRQAVTLTAQRLAEMVDELLQVKWNRRSGMASGAESGPEVPAQVEATCACGSGIPLGRLVVEGREVRLAALPLIYENFLQQGKPINEATGRELCEVVGIYNPIPAGEEGCYQAALLEGLAAYRASKEAGR